MSFDNKQDPPVYGVEDLEKGPAIDEKSNEYELETEVDSDEDTPLYHGKKHGGKGQFFGRGRGGKHFKHFSPGPYAAYYSQFPPPPPHHHHHHHAFGARGHHHQHGYGFPAPPPPPPPHGVFAAQSNDPYYHPFAGKRKKRFSLKRVVFLAILALSAFVFFGLGRAYECKQMEMFHSRGHHGPEHHDFRMQEGGRHHGYKPKHRKPHHKDDDEDVEAERFPVPHHQEGKDHKKGSAHSQEEFHAEGEEFKGKGHKGAKGKDHKGKHHEGESKDEVKGQEGEAKQHKGKDHKAKGKGHKGKDHKNKGENNREQVSEHQAEAVSEEKKEQDQK